MELYEYLAEVKKVKLLDVEQERSLWQAYKEDLNTEARCMLIESYQPLVFKAVAPFRSAENVMDLIQEGMVGLIEAVENYQHKRGVAFSLYALHRIRGRMLNFLQKEGVDNLTYIDSNVYNDEGVCKMDACLVDGTVDIATQAEDKVLVSVLKGAFDRLPPKEQQVLSGVYWNDQEPRQVAESMDVSTSHIYRLQKQGIRRIRGFMSKFMQHW